MLRCLLALCLLVSGPAHAAAERVVTLGGSVTEIVYDLGQGGRLVADDESSMYPEAARELPRVGYYRSVPVEGVVAMKPDLVLASENAGPPKALERLKGLGIPLTSVSDKPTIDSLYDRIQQVASELQVPEQGRELSERVREDVAAAQAEPSTARRAVVLVNRTGPLLGAGGNTAANAVLALAGLENALAQQAGYKPVSAEGLALLAPDMIIVSEASVKASGGMEKLTANPAIAATPAAREGRVVAMNDLLILGIGPRVGDAIRLLKEAAH
ncbi:heme/hemin ABC transporter substrate-binding protein [Parapusillimonas sp. JC17]|uniref:heme/hemin ABC transporter substrate-binding protein n=1 Tax=Parapusillimonas sp. JC17 TaxID=3445768 RepID=UPI003FA0A862